MTDTKRDTKENKSHTPGPWAKGTINPMTQKISIGRPILNPVYTSTGGRGSQHVAECATRQDSSTEETEANAHLIASAPGLLTSLQEVVRICEALRYTAGLGKNQVERIERAKAAIAEATGRVS